MWAIIAGRGAGKTRSGAEFVLDRCVAFATTTTKHLVALVGRTVADVRDIMIRGESGLMACAERRGIRAVYTPSIRTLELPDLNTSMTTYSAEEPDQLRGPQHHTAWGDEPAAWSGKVDAQGNSAWTNLQFGLRLDPPPALGMVPQVCVTTTPKPIPLVIEWFRQAGLAPEEDGQTFRAPDPTLVLTQASMYDNLANLSPSFVSLITGAYGGTRLGAQEIEGQLLSAVEGALWQPEYIEPYRVTHAPDLQRIVVAVDPPGSATGAECGIIVAGNNRSATMPTPAELTAARRAGLAAELIAQTHHAYVLADVSVRGRTEQWAAAAVAAFRAYGADVIVGEVNNGGDMVRAAVHAIDPTIPFEEVRATRGKSIRAEPVAILYARGRVHHVGMFGLLESQLLTWVESEGMPSPDRLDACLAEGTPVLTRRGEVPIEWVHPGDDVWTRRGWRMVEAARMTRRAAEVVEVHLSSGRVLTCTPDHRIAVDDTWRRADALVCGDRLSGWISPPSPSSSKVSVTPGTPLADHATSGSTTGVRPSPCTGPCTATTTGAFLSVASSTTSTTTRSTTIPATSQPSPQPSTPPRTKARWGSPRNTWPRSVSWRRSGTDPRKAEPGTVNTAGPCGKAGNRFSSLIRALGAGVRSSRWSRLVMAPGSVVGGAAAGSLTERTATGCSCRARCAGPSSGRASTRPSPRHAAVRVVHVSAASARADVYDLQVEGEHEFTAAGAVVHNCVWAISALMPHLNTTPAKSKSPSGARVQTGATAAARRQTGGLRLPQPRRRG